MQIYAKKELNVDENASTANYKISTTVLFASTLALNWRSAEKRKNDETQVSDLLGNFLLLIKEPMKDEFVVESRTV